MNTNNINEMLLFEHHFWLQILGDHSRFIFNALSPKETSLIEEAQGFINLFDDLLEKSRHISTEAELTQLNSQAYNATMSIRAFKLLLLAKHIKGKITISLSPTFINHMINELEEYLFILNNLMRGKIPPAGPIHLHMLWLPDGTGHASIIAANLDMTQKELIKKSREYAKIFTDLYLTTIEYNGYTRTGICDFPALKKLNSDANNIMSCFKEFLKELEGAIIDKKVLGILLPLALDHMFREECYYLTKLSMVSDIKAPECDPTKPRIEE